MDIEAVQHMKDLSMERFRLKELEDQVIVITGASSGIGLVTARMAAKRGAKVVLAARNENALRELTNELISEWSTSVAPIKDRCARPAIMSKHPSILSSHQPF